MRPDVTGDEWVQPQWSIGRYGRSPGRKSKDVLIDASRSFFLVERVQN